LIDVFYKGSYDNSRLEQICFRNKGIVYFSGTGTYWALDNMKLFLPQRKNKQKNDIKWLFNEEKMKVVICLYFFFNFYFKNHTIISFSTYVDSLYLTRPEF
jgi:hypothetical protein